MSIPLYDSRMSPTRLVIMQPYLFPYLGYFQLLAAADRFVIYDDVQFIKGGWINRNRLLINGQPLLFTVPLDAPSPNRNICDINLSSKPNWRSKLLQTIGQGYRRAAHFEPVFSLVERIFANTMPQTIADLVRVSLMEIIEYTGITVDLVPTSSSYSNQHLRSQERVLDICRLEGATSYINAQGGRTLYNHEAFAQHRLSLHFLQPELTPYRQLNKGDFISGLSIIDVLMNNSIAETNALLQQYKLID